MLLDDDGTTRLLIDAALAIGIGLFIGLEREHSDVSKQPLEVGSDIQHEALLGVRTFALLALFGWVSAYSGAAHPWLPAASVVVVGALVAVTVFRERERGGLTTEIAALTTLVLGMLVHYQRSVAVALALATTLLLISKPWFRSVIPRMRRVDLTSTLQLFILLAIILPLLPDEARDPWGVLSPRRIGIFVALIAGIGYVGYVVNRLLGGQRAAGLTGFVGGLVSSTAVTVAMAQHARTNPAMIPPGQLAVFIANTVMLVRVLVVSALILPAVTWSLVAPLGAMAVCMMIGVAWKWAKLRSADRESSRAGELSLQNPFSLLPALKWGALFAAILVASAVGREAFGDSGFIATSALSGVVDVDAVTLAATRLAASGEIDLDIGALAITVAVVSNTIVKGGIAWVSGKRNFGADIAKVFAAAIALGLLVSVGLVML